MNPKSPMIVLGLVTVTALIFAGCNPRSAKVKLNHKPSDKIEISQNITNAFISKQSGSYESLNGATAIKLNADKTYGLRRSIIVPDKNGMSILCQVEESGVIVAVQAFGEPQSSFKIHDTEIQGATQSWTGFINLRLKGAPRLVTATEYNSQEPIRIQARRVNEEFRPTCANVASLPPTSIMPLVQSDRDYFMTASADRLSGSSLLIRTNRNQIPLDMWLLKAIIHMLNQALNSQDSSQGRTVVNLDSIANTLTLSLYAGDEEHTLCQELRVSMVKGFLNIPESTAVIEVAQPRSWVNHEKKTSCPSSFPPTIELVKSGILPQHLSIAATFEGESTPVREKIGHPLLTFQ